MDWLNKISLLGQREIPALLANAPILPQNQKKKVLFWIGSSWSYSVIDCLLAAALRFRGHKPLMLVAQGAGMGLAPYMFTTKDEKYTLNRDNIICIASTEKEMADKYVESTTGLKLN